MIILGVDLGLTGALAAQNTDTNEIDIYDLPTIELEKSSYGQKNIYDIYGVVEILKKYSPATLGHNNVLLVMELLHPVGGARSDENYDQTKQVKSTKRRVFATPQSNFNNGGSKYMLSAACVALQIPYREISPNKFKNSSLFDGLADKRDKEAVRLRVVQTIPSVAHKLNLKKHHNRAEAVLLSEYGRKYLI